MNAPLLVSLEAGSILAGKYRIERVLGEGGMGIVVEATHLELDQKVAIKTLRPELAGVPDLVERFLREGRAAAKIEGEHVARVLDVVRADGGPPLLVMEFLEGHDLSVVRMSRKPLGIRTAVGHVLQACEALSQAHGLGIIHRDLKPANLFLARRRDGTERIKVLDFGISKMPGKTDTSTSLTQTTAVMGSAEYMSPEHMVSTRDVDARTDIWALGVVLYELTTGEVPFPGDSITQVCALVMSRPARPPRQLRPDLPTALESVILRCLEKDRDRRFASIDDLAEALFEVWSRCDEEPDAGARTALASARVSSSSLVVGALRGGLRRPADAPRVPSMDIADEPTELADDPETTLAARAPEPAPQRASSTTAATSSEPVPLQATPRRTGLAIGAAAAAAVAILVAVLGLREGADSSAPAPSPTRASGPSAPGLAPGELLPVAPAPPAVVPVAASAVPSATAAPSAPTRQDRAASPSRPAPARSATRPSSTATPTPSSPQPSPPPPPAPTVAPPPPSGID